MNKRVNNNDLEQVERILKSILPVYGGTDYSREQREQKPESMPKANTVVLGDNDVVVSKEYLELANSIKKLIAQTDIQLEEKPKPLSRKKQKELEIQLKLQQAHKKALERK